MGVFSGPDVSESGLVLALDAGNRRSFANSVINSTSWSLGSGSASGYNQNGSTIENERVTGTDPFGKSATVWETRPTGTTDADGGWNSDWYNIDNTKLYRFSVWVKRTTSTSGGTFYLGLYGNASGVRRTDNNAYEGNPYWECSGTSKFTQNVWYLVVGHCYPYNTTYTGQHPESGIYTVAGGTTKVLSINACNIGTDVKWAGSDVTQTLHRCYHYYCSDNTTRLQFFDPRIDAIDGTHPSIGDLLSGFTASRLNDLAGTNNGTFVNAPTYSSANGGSIVFDGTNDYLSGSLGTLNAPFTLECFGKFNNTSQSNYEYFGSIGDFSANGMISISKIGTQDPNSSYHGFMYVYPGSGDAKKTNIDLRTTNYQHLVVVLLSSSPYIKVYKNGVEGSMVDSLTAPINTNGNYRIGTWANSTWWLNGNISSFKVYNRALTAAEVQQNFNATRSRFGI